MTLHRADSLRRLADEHFDVLVVGAGITGAGAALDAATRGLRTALIDKGDFASGTSSKSSKLVHGGLRYLQQKEIRLVYEALSERQLLRHTAPHLVRILPFMIPIFSKDGLIPRSVAKVLGSAMWMYDLTGGARIGKLHKRISKDDALAHMPTLPADRLAPSYLYYDARADDARLTLAVARTASDYGAAVANYATLTRIVKDGSGHACGARITADGAEIEVHADTIVNATGVWADDVRSLDESVHPDTIRPAKGIHITVPWSKVRNDIAVVVPVPKDRRSVFVVPWGDDNGQPAFTYIGTTDTDYDGPLDDPQCTPEDVAYLLRAINFSVTTDITESDVLGAWAGLRPLVRSATTKRTADLSRRHTVNRSASGVITVTGGKLTTYRRMAADAIDDAVDLLGRGGKSNTKKIRLAGAIGWDAPGLPPHLAARFGGDARRVLALAADDPSLAEPLVPGLSYIRAEAVYAAREEMALSVDDVLTRRTRARILARDTSADAADEVARLLAGELGWSEVETARQAAEYRASVAAERTSAHLPVTALDAALGA